MLQFNHDGNANITIEIFRTFILKKLKKFYYGNIFLKITHFIQ